MIPKNLFFTHEDKHCLLPRVEYHGIVYLCITIPIYFFLAHLSTKLAIANPTYHDIIPLYSEYAIYAVQFLLILSVLLATITKPNYDTLFKRLSLMYVLKGIAQLVTINPQPNGVDICINSSFWEFRNCADMMFSGHTAFTYLILYKCKYRYFLTFAMAFQLVMANWHYIADCFIAFIVAYAVEKKIVSERCLQDSISVLFP